MAERRSGEPSGLGEHCQEIARRFLLTAVVVDDELSAPAVARVHSGLTGPDPRGSRRSPDQANPPRRPSWPLKVDPITWSFARQGMVCGVIAPQERQDDVETLARAVSRADIVILDWRLNRTSGENALPLLRRILRDDQPGRFRLIAFYTGEPDRRDIRSRIAETLDGLNAPHEAVRTNDGSNPITFGSCRIVVYGKPGSSAVNSNTTIDEGELASRLIADVAEMAQGLLPSIVLTALAAVRENVYRVLDRFGPDLDPAFLAHRACLRQPTESEEHIVEQIASELHGIMDDSVSEANPAGFEAIKHWLAERFADDQILFGADRQASAKEVLQMLSDGIEKEPPGNLGKKNWHRISHGLAERTSDVGELDRRLASTMSFRQVLKGKSRQLSMGTVVRRLGNGDSTLLCVTPRCDSVRLTKDSSFLFLPLSEPRGSTLQVVVPVGGDRHERMTISDNPSEWLMEDFAPDPVAECVLADRGGLERGFTFHDVGGREYQWLGELKPEFAQAIAQAIAKRMSRLPLNKSEWLRRSEGIGKRAN